MSSSWLKFASNSNLANSGTDWATEILKCVAESPFHCVPLYLHVYGRKMSSLWVKFASNSKSANSGTDWATEILKYVAESLFHCVPLYTLHVWPKNVVFMVKIRIKWKITWKNVLSNSKIDLTPQWTPIGNHLLARSIIGQIFRLIGLVSSRSAVIYWIKCQNTVLSNWKFNRLTWKFYQW